MSRPDGGPNWGPALLRGCTDREVARFMARADWLDVPAGHVLARPGDRGGDVHVILVGRATVHDAGQLVAQLGPGDYCGELAPLELAPTATVVMETAGTLLVVPQPAFFSLLAELPTVVQRMLGRLAPGNRSWEDPADDRLFA